MRRTCVHRQALRCEVWSLYVLKFGKTNYMGKVEEVIDLPCFKMGGVVHIRQESSISRY